MGNNRKKWQRDCPVSKQRERLSKNIPNRCTKCCCAGVFNCSQPIWFNPRKPRRAKPLSLTGKSSFSGLELPRLQAVFRAPFGLYEIFLLHKKTSLICKEYPSESAATTRTGAKRCASRGLPAPVWDLLQSLKSSFLPVNIQVAIKAEEKVGIVRNNSPIALVAWKSCCSWQHFPILQTAPPV